MKKVLAAILIVFLAVSYTYAADTKGSALDATSGVAPATDKLYVIDATGPSSKADTVQTVVDSALAAPAAIGSGTPAAGSFTTLGSTTFNLPSSNADPATTAGQLRHDTTITGLTGGALKYWNGTNVRILVDLDTAPSDDDYVVAYDADADKFYMKADATGGGTTMANDAMWAAAGDIAIATANDTGGILSIGTAGQILKVNSGATAPEWTSTLSGLTFDLGTATNAQQAVVMDADGILTTTLTALLPAGNDTAAIGSATNSWSDLFLASGGVINFNNGNATLTHSAGLLTSNVPISVGTSNALTVGTIELGAASDTTISRTGAGAIAVEGVGVRLNSAKEKIATFGWDGGGSAVPTGATTKRCAQVPFAATITGVFIKADASSTLTITPYKDAFSTSAMATTALISGAGTTGLSTAMGVNDTTLTNWTTAVSANDEICAQVASNDNAKWISMQIYGTR